MKNINDELVRVLEYPLLDLVSSQRLLLLKSIFFKIIKILNEDDRYNGVDFFKDSCQIYLKEEFKDIGVSKGFETLVRRLAERVGKVLESYPFIRNVFVTADGSMIKLEEELQDKPFRESMEQQVLEFLRTAPIVSGHSMGKYNRHSLGLDKKSDAS